MNEVSREILTQYMKMVFQWNLTSKMSQHNFWQNQILNSAQLMNYLPNHNSVVLDVGSGNGLPGFILSVQGMKNVILVEPMIRRYAFLMELKRLSKNHIQIFNDKIQNLHIQCDVLVCKAFMKIVDLLDATKHLLIHNKYLLLKGKTYREEIDKAQQRWNLTFNISDSKTLNGGKIIEIFKWEPR